MNFAVDWALKTNFLSIPWGKSRDESQLRYTRTTQPALLIPILNIIIMIILVRHTVLPGYELCADSDFDFDLYIIFGGITFESP